MLMTRTLTTSYAGIVDRGQARPGEWVLVHAAAGGVGLAAVQIAKAIGCKVIGAAGSEEKRRIVKDKGGADEVVDYTKDGWQVSSFCIVVHGVQEGLHVRWGQLQVIRRRGRTKL